MLTHIDLFAGIGGFALGFQKAGIKTLAHVEIDAKCQGVLRKRFEGDLILGDVRDCGAHNLPYADAITFGSPCQDMSVAGKREGLNGQRSGLFFEAVRIIRECKPRIAVWENVPGALSSNRGQDFRAVIEAFLQIEVPMPRSGKWANSGMARNGSVELVWRILDAQYFGLAQRRKRLFVVVGFRREGAAEILLEREGSAGNLETGRETGEIFPTISAGGAGTSHTGNSRSEVDMMIVPIVSSKWAKGTGGPFGDEAQNLIAAPLTSKPYADNKAQDSKPVYPTLDAGTQGAKWGSNQWIDNGFAVVQPSEDRIDRWVDEPDRVCMIQDDGYSSTAQEHVYFKPNAAVNSLEHARPPKLISGGVRRLTPMECERLQGFPDGWTDLPQSDSARYHQLGNAVAVPCAEWIARRIMQVLET